jgi:hypothetical protein
MERPGFPLHDRGKRVDGSFHQSEPPWARNEGLMRVETRLYGLWPNR